MQYVLSEVRAREVAGKKSEATLQVGGFKMVIPPERIRKGKYRTSNTNMNLSGKLSGS